MFRVIKILCMYILSLNSLIIASTEDKTLIQDIKDTLVSISGAPFSESSLKLIELQPFTPEELNAAIKSSLIDGLDPSVKKELRVKKQKNLSDINLGKTIYLAKDALGQPVGTLQLSISKPMLTIEKWDFKSSSTEQQIMLASILASAIDLAREAEQKSMKIIVNNKDKDKDTIQTLIYLDFKLQGNGTDNIKTKKQQVWILDLADAKKILNARKKLVIKPIERPR